MNPPGWNDTARLNWLDDHPLDAESVISDARRLGKPVRKAIDVWSQWLRNAPTAADMARARETLARPR